MNGGYDRQMIIGEMIYAKKTAFSSIKNNRLSFFEVSSFINTKAKRVILSCSIDILSLEGRIPPTVNSLLRENIHVTAFLAKNNN